MANIIKPGNGIIYMKVGLHAQEGIDEIIERKKGEYDQTGMVFWGYGGNTCHPSSYVQPFVRQHESQGQQVQLVMHKMDSKHRAEPEIAKEYSEDGIDWKPVPPEIQVRGSRWAMVLGELTETEFDLNLHDLVVAVGNSRGKPGDQYLRGRVDKGCFDILEPQPEEGDQKTKIDLIAPLQAPYAVFLR